LNLGDNRLVCIEDLAMADLNKVFLMGNLSFDPELRRTPSGTAVAELRMVTSRSWMSKDGERREEKLFIDVTVWDRQAENCCQYLRKGSPIHVEGSLKMDTWDDKSTGEKRSKIRVHADRVQFLDSRRGDSQGDAGPSADDDATASRRTPAASGRASGGAGEPRGAAETASFPRANSQAANATGGAHDDEGEDIPF
jgi:single-strand DNA-binding protein